MYDFYCKYFILFSLLGALHTRLVHDVFFLLLGQALLKMHSFLVRNAIFKRLNVIIQRVGFNWLACIVSSHPWHLQMAAPILLEFLNHRHHLKAPRTNPNFFLKIKTAKNKITCQRKLNDCYIKIAINLTTSTVALKTQTVLVTVS